VAAVGIYRLTKARSAFWIVAALAYTLTTRTLITISQAYTPGADMRWIDDHASYIIVGFWPLMAIGMVLLLRSLRGLVRPDRRRNLSNDAYYSGPDRRRTNGGNDARQD
jgi:hypothetical protein